MSDEATTPTSSSGWIIWMNALIGLMIPFALSFLATLTVIQAVQGS